MTKNKREALRRLVKLGPLIVRSDGRSVYGLLAKEGFVKPVNGIVFQGRIQVEATESGRAAYAPFMEEDDKALAEFLQRRRAERESRLKTA